MYYPVQIPYVLNKEFSEAVLYAEKAEPLLKDFMVCFWQMESKNDNIATVENIIITDGCIDLVADFVHRQIGFVGMRKTNFEFKINAPCLYYGARLKPGAFYALTGIHASKAMDGFISLDEWDTKFDSKSFFELPLKEAERFFQKYLITLAAGKNEDVFMRLFDKLYCDIPDSAEQVYRLLNFSPKQCQRLFYRHFGLTPQMVLCILRFQKCLKVLTFDNAKKCDVLSEVNYYDQSHFIKDFKRNIGLTPFELLQKYK